MNARSRPTAVVIGANGTTGLAVCERLAQDGFAIVLADVSALAPDDPALRPFADAVAGTHAVDLRQEESVAALAANVREQAGEIDALVVVAGVLQESSAVTGLAVEEWDQVLAVNLRGPFLACKWLAPLLPDGRRSSIVTTGSWWGYEGHAYFSAYCASKAGLRVLTQALAAELAPRGVRVNLVAPGNIDTPMHHRALAAEAVERGIGTDEMRAIEWAKIPLGAPARPSDIADAIAFLCGPGSDYMTGSVVDVNGGVVFR